MTNPITPELSGGVAVRLDELLGRKTENDMPMHKNVFVPHAHCTVTSGDCFTEGKCLAQCSAVRKKDHEARIRELERTVVRLELMLNNRSVPPHLAA